MKILFSGQASKDILKSPKFIQLRVKKNLEMLTGSPLKGIPLSGELRGKRKIRIGQYRLIYSFSDEEQTINIVAFGSRGAIYK